LNLLKKIFIAFVSVGLIGGLFVFGLIIIVSFDLPQISSLSDYNPPIPSKILSRDGQVLVELGKEKRKIVEFKDIPKRIVEAFLSAEDDNFYKHAGIDYLGVLRAMLANLKAGRVVQGGSTITQQVAKSLLLTREKTITRKIKDFLLARKMEQKLSKQDILFLYLNQVYLGGGYYGIKEAFRGYFNKELEEATIAEAALIAGLLVAPGKYSPYVNPKRAKIRQQYVLKRLYETQKISDSDYQNALSEVIRIRKRDSNEMLAGHFTDWIRQRVIDELGSDNFLNNGYEVTTTLDWSLQQKAEQYIKTGAAEIDKRQGFKGPLKQLNSMEINSFILETRKKLLDKYSTYFNFKADGEVIDELFFDSNEWQENRKTSNELMESMSGYERKLAQIGNEEDDLSNLLKTDELYEAVVERISDSMRVVFASIGGVSVIIPYEQYRWAHERVISEERRYFPYIIHPSSILKVGDVIQVSILRKSITAWPYIYSKFKETNKSEKIEQHYKREKFHLALLDQIADAEAALLALNPRTGEIISMVGGTNFEKSQFNRAIQSNRQPGSAFKPFIYAAALEHGYTPASILLDSPQALGGVDSNLDWKPRNYDGKFNGEMTFRRSLEVSRNIPTIMLLQDIGVDKILDLVKRFKMRSSLPEDLSISLGSFGISLIELVKAYAVFPNGGKLVRPKAIISVKDRYGNFISSGRLIDHAEEELSDSDTADDKLETDLITDKQDDEKVKKNQFIDNLTGDQVFDPRLAYIMSNLLKGVIQSGTGKAAKSVSPFIGGKTGTTNSYVDAWFVGFSSKLALGVWTGFDDNQTLGFGETGAKSALPIWSDFMRQAISRYGEDDFYPPRGIINVAINGKTGKLLKNQGRNGLMEAFVEGTEPGSEIVNKELDDTTKDIVIDDDEYYSSQ
jgi:penicillin-binding protein 1A